MTPKLQMMPLLDTDLQILPTLEICSGHVTLRNKSVNILIQYILISCCLKLTRLGEVRKFCGFLTYSSGILFQSSIY